MHIFTVSLCQKQNPELIVGLCIRSPIGLRSAAGFAYLSGAGIVEEEKADNGVSGLEFRYKYLYQVVSSVAASTCEGWLHKWCEESVVGDLAHFFQFLVF